ELGQNGVLLFLRQIGKTFGKFCLRKAFDGSKALPVQRHERRIVARQSDVEVIEHTDLNRAGRVGFGKNSRGDGSECLALRWSQNPKSRSVILSRIHSR